MLVKKMVHFAMITFVLLLESSTDAASTSFKLCGRTLVEALENVCKEYNSPSWDVPTVIEQPTGIVRRKRGTGIADRCCISTCRLTELIQYCSVIKLESPLELMEEHMIEDRSAEGAAASSPAVFAKEEREVGRSRSRGYGAKARGRRCWCRRKRTGRRRTSLMESRKKCRARCSRRRHRLAAAHVGKNSEH